MSISKFSRSCWVTAFAMIPVLNSSWSSHAAELSLKSEKKPAPAALSAEIRGLLSDQAVCLLNDGKPAFEFWFRKELPLTAAPKEPGKALDAVKQTVLLGAVQVTGDMRDYRDDELRAGVYTMRLALQPNDGDHLGTSDFAYFAVLVPARSDTTPEGIADYKSLTKASSKATSTDHPVILSLRPATGASGSYPSLQTPAPEHKSVRVRIPGRAGETKSDVIMDVVYEGKGHK